MLDDLIQKWLSSEVAIIDVLSTFHLLILYSIVYMKDFIRCLYQTVLNTQYQIQCAVIGSWWVIDLQIMFKFFEVHDININLKPYIFYLSCLIPMDLTLLSNKNL